MRNDAQEQTVSDLLNLVEEERNAVLWGDLDHVARVFERKSDLIEALNGMERADSADLEELRSRIERNQMLLEAAKRGARMALARLKSMRRSREMLTLYDAHGWSVDHPTLGHPTFERRA